MQLNCTDILVRKYSLIRHRVLNDKKDQHIQLYHKIFHCAKLCGLLPFEFNSQTLTLTPITSGRWYYFFLFNLFYIFASICKAAFLLFYNWWTNFEEEEISGGYLLQASYIVGCLQVFSVAYCYTFNKKRFGLAISSCLQMEANILKSKFKKHLLYY